VARGRRVEHDQVIVGEAPDDHVGDALQQRRLLHARRLARQLHVAVHLAGEVLGHQAPQRRTHLREMFLHHVIRVEFDAVEVGREAHRVRPDLPVPDVAEVMRRVRGDQQHAPPGVRLGQGHRGGDSGLADAALAAEEEHPALPGEI
jgi:hypothetical protein